MNKLQEMKLRLNGAKLHQTDAREYKAVLHEIIKAGIKELYDIEINEIQNALLLEIPHDELGAIPVEMKLIIKQIDYDVATAVEEYQEKEQARLDRLKEKEAKK